MNRHEWGELVGDGGTVVDDLRWSLFQSERCRLAIKTDIREGRSEDRELLDGFHRQVIDARFALAALWARR